MIQASTVRTQCLSFVLGVLTLVPAADTLHAALPASVNKTVYAQVLKVTPLHRPVAQCVVKNKPAQPQGLMAQLRWDFEVQCSDIQAEARTYEVTYTWDGRTYTEKLSYDPGKHIPLQVRYR
jgi:uncharacterized protein YcfJ